MPFVVLFVLILVLGGGCAASGEFTSHDTTVTNTDGSTTYNSHYSDGSVSGDTTCTMSKDYSTTDCTTK